MRNDAHGMFWDETPKQRTANRIAAIMPPIPENGWMPPHTLPNLSNAQVISLDTETYDPDLLTKGPGWARGVGHLVGVSLAVETGEKWYIPIRHEIEPEINYDPDIVIEWLKRTLGNPKQPKVGANLLYDIGWLREEGVIVRGELMDVQYAEALLDESASVALETLGQKYLDEGKDSPALYEWCAAYYGGKVNSGQRRNIYRSPARLVGPYAESDADLPLRIIQQQWSLLQKEGLMGVFKMECDLIPMYVDMRFAGVTVNIPYAEKLSEELLVKELGVQQNLEKLVGFGVNVNAPDSLVKIFDSQGLKYHHTVAGNPSFTKEFLKGVTGNVGKLINDIRKFQKLRGTFVDSYILDSHINGKVHGQFHPLRNEGGGTRSGRYSCVAEWSPIVTPRGILPIKEVRVGDLVWTHNNRWKSVTHTWLKGFEQMYDVTFDNGETLTCTKDHKLLTFDREWVTLGSIINASIKKMVEKKRESSKSRRTLQNSRDPNYWRSSQGYVNKLSQYTRGVKASDTFRRVKSTTEASLLSVKDREQQPDGGKNGGTAPQLHRGVRGRLRLLDNKEKRETPFCSSCSHGRSLGAFYRITAYLGRSPHRWEYPKQRTGQLGVVHQCWAQDYPLLTGEGQQVLEIKKIDVSGSFDVYDITVAEDASYLSCGVFSHNSSMPNLQNIPSNDPELAPMIRGLFIPDVGHDCWRKYDYAQIEYRFMVHYAVGASGDRARAMFAKDPDLDYHKFAQKLVFDKTGMKIERKPIKRINFGLIYGMGKETLRLGLGISKSEGENLFSAYFDAVDFAKPTMDFATREALDTGVIKTFLGRKSRFDLWESTKYSKTNRAMPLDKAIQTYGSIKRAGTHKALNRRLQGSAADQLKAALHKCYMDGIYDDIGVPRMLVHDECNHSDPGGKDEGFKEMRHIFETVLPLKVPIKFDYEKGEDWGHVVEQ